MIKVRINKCSSILSWYTDQVGSELHVRETGFDGKYSFGDTEYLINKSDCTVILADTEQEEKKFVLPEKWYFKSDNTRDKDIYDWREHKIKYSYMYILSEFNGKKGWNVISLKEIPIGYTEITQDQFFAHVWENEFKKEEPKVINVSKETAEKVKEIFESNQLKPIEPVIIAKAGEWVKIVEWGICLHREEIFSINKPYQLKTDFFYGSDFDIIEDNSGDVNGYRGVTANTMKFERCESPVPVVQETTESDFVEKPTIGLLNRITHSEIRIKDIINAIQRFDEAELEIPTEWYKELYELSKFINQ